MIRMKSIFRFFSIILLLGIAFVWMANSCRLPYGYRYKKGHFPAEIRNMGAFNTRYDDYNATAPSFWDDIPFCFSSNRYTRGGTFDIVFTIMETDFDKTTGAFKMNRLSADAEWLGRFRALKDAMDTINTPANEFGPYLTDAQNIDNGRGDYYTAFTLMYASDSSGHLDIYYTDNYDRNIYASPRPLDFLNSPADDAYPVFDSTRNHLYFCSNRAGTFDIYAVRTDPALSVNRLAETNRNTPERISVLSSSANDKCPFIKGHLLVFASDRPGGYGGFDLYYSVWEHGHWSEPVNFGATINTAYDEYRPIIFSAKDYDNHVMIFSSNRPGGKGGFDLYYTGIAKDFPEP